MKRKDLTIIIAVAVIAGLFSFVISSLLFGGEKAYNLKAPQVEPISTEFTSPSSKYFNDNAINPTVDIEIGDTTNPDVLQD